MKQFSMADRKGSSNRKPIPKSRPTDDAFDHWLNRGLHQLFDDVMNEPVPPELLKIVQDDQNRSDQAIDGKIKDGKTRDDKAKDEK